VPSNYYDDDQDWFVVQDAVLDLKALRASAIHGDESKVAFNWYPHDASRPVTKYFDAPRDYGKNLGHWDSFLGRSITDAESRGYLQIVTGAAMMGESKLRCILNLVGPPHSGKSVYVDTMFTLGKDGAGYAAMPDSRALTKVTGQNFEQDHFRGRRFIGISEPSSTEKIDDDFIKRFTGDIWVETRTLNAKSEGWIPQGVIFCASNNNLKINTREPAIVQRVQVIEFPIHFELPVPGVLIPEERRAIEGLEELLLEDRSRILTWILIGMRKFVAGGMKLHPPTAVLEKRGEVVAKASTALRFIEDYIEDEYFEINFDAAPQYCVPIQEAYNQYNIWAAKNGEKRPLPKKFFQEDIENWYNSNGVKVRHDGKNRFYGIKVTDKYQLLYGVGDYHEAENQ
jgi:putative DNA primase/helicase